MGIMKGEFNKMYQSARWKTRRRLFLKQNPFCVECKKENRLVFAEICDHIAPHKGDWRLFIDNDNLQPLCKFHHGLKSQKEK